MIAKIPKWFAFLFPVGIFISIVFAYRHFLPIWDSREYLSVCILPAVSQPFNLMSFNCSNHGALFFGLLYGFLQYLDFGNMYFVHAVSLTLMLAGFWFFYLVAKKIFTESRWVLLSMLLVACQPAILANTLNPSPDLVVLALGMICLWCFVARDLRFAPLVGIGLFFSKESGVIYYSLCCLIYFIVYFRNRSQWKSFFKQHWSLLIPYVLYGFFMWYKTTIAGSSLLFNKIPLTFLLERFFVIDWSDKYFHSALSAIFVLNFQWVVTLFLLAGGLFWLFNAHGAKSRQPIVFITLLTVLLLGVLSRFPHFLNVRYYLPLFPLMTILFVVVLQKLFSQKGFLLGAVFALLLLFSCFRTIDPVSRAVYGTFDFGKHSLLKMVSISGECCGYGRDQLVYNLEYVQIQNLLNQFSEQIKLQNEDVLLTEPATNFFLYANIDNNTYRWTLKNKNVHAPQYVQSLQEIKNKSGRIFYPIFPNVENKRFFAENNKIITVESSGYQITFVELDKGAYL